MDFFFFRSALTYCLDYSQSLFFSSFHPTQLCFFCKLRYSPFPLSPLYPPQIGTELAPPFSFRVVDLFFTRFHLPPTFLFSNYRFTSLSRGKLSPRPFTYLSQTVVPRSPKKKTNKNLQDSSNWTSPLVSPFRPRLSSHAVSLHIGERHSQHRGLPS